MKKLNNRKIVTYCYDHIGGILGEAIFEFLLREKWIEKDGEKQYHITEKGWEELEIMGVQLEKISSTSPKTFTSCHEKHHGIYHEHAGSPLGNLITDLLIEQEWIIKKGEDNLLLTKKGLRGLQSLGILTKNVIQQI